MSCCKHMRRIVILNKIVELMTVDTEEEKTKRTPSNKNKIQFNLTSKSAYKPVYVSTMNSISSIKDRISITKISKK